MEDVICSYLLHWFSGPLSLSFLILSFVICKTRIIKWSPAYSHRGALRILQGNCWGSTLEIVPCPVPTVGLTWVVLQLSLKRVSPISGWEMDYFFRGCLCLAAAGPSLMHVLSASTLPQPCSSAHTIKKTTLVPSMSANGCLSVPSLAPSPKLSSVSDPFFDAR